MRATPEERDARIAGLEAELARVQQRLTIALRRADLLEESCQRAYRLAATTGARVRPVEPREDP